MTDGGTKGETDAEPADKKQKKRRSGMGIVLFAIVTLAGTLGAWSYLGQRTRPELPGAAPQTVADSQLPAQTAPVPDNAALIRLEARLQRIEAALAARPSDLGDPGVTAKISEKTAGLERRVAALESQARTPAASDHTAAALGFALGRLRAAVFEGRPYGADLDRVSRLIAAASEDTPGSGETRMQGALDSLRGHATAGIPTVDSLRAEFGAAARVILSKEPRDGGWTGDLRDRLASLVTVRRIGDIAGDDPEARVARAEVRLRDGNLAAAVEELAGLDGAPATAAAPWLAAAGARLAAGQAVDDLDAAAADMIAGGN